MTSRRRAARATIFLCTALAFLSVPAVDGARGAEPTPLLKQGQPVDWWFAFKFNAATFPGCGGTQQCPFGGKLQDYVEGERFAYASNTNAALQAGSGCNGETVNDPLGATFDAIYNGTLNYVVWNDQFYGDPAIEHCGKDCGAPWGHSKGALAWDDSGAGFVLQVTTPSWPAAGSKTHPRKSDGNTLGCIKNDDDIKVSQHFFALKLSDGDVLTVLTALATASVVTDPGNPQIVKSGGPAKIRQAVEALGKKSTATEVLKTTLSSKVILIAKPSDLEVPPWQMVSALLDGVPLRVATWWTWPEIPTTTTKAKPACWDAKLAAPGPVAIATTGRWQDKTIGLTGGGGNDFNHAKIGVSTAGPHPYTIFGDMNQQGALKGVCHRSQNGRGGMFFVIENAALHASVTDLIKGDTGPTQTK
jgi:hypothetical protein